MLFRSPGAQGRRTGGEPAQNDYRGFAFHGGDSVTDKKLSAAGKSPALPAGYAGIHSGIVELLDAARHAAARSVNALMTASYWEIGRRLIEAEQQGKRRAGYGEKPEERRVGKG